MTGASHQPGSDEPQLRLVACDGRDVQRPHFAPTAAQAATLEDVAVAIADVCSMPMADAIAVLERARQSIPREVAAVRSIFATLAEFQAAGA